MVARPETASHEKVLTDRPRNRSVDITARLTAASAAGTPPLAVAFDILRRSMGRQKLSYKDYFLLGLDRRNLTAADRDAFASEREVTRLNDALQAPRLQSCRGVTNSKLLTELLLRSAGLPTSTTLAVARSQPVRLPVPVLIGADAVARYLRDEATYPMFGKPDDASLGLGAASFMAREGDELLLGDGTRRPLRSLAEEIARDYPDGYLFQYLLRPHPALAKLIGPVVGTLRVHSLRLAHGPEPTYAMLKLPGPGAMVDGALSGSNGVAIVDLATGTITRAQLLSDPIGRDMVAGHVTGARLPGAVLPDFNDAVALALEAHRLFPHQGVLGSDVILTESGPLINEVNCNPLGGLVQKGLGHGLFTEAFKAKCRLALALHGIKGPVRGVRI